MIFGIRLASCTNGEIENRKSKIENVCKEDGMIRVANFQTVEPVGENEAVVVANRRLANGIKVVIRDTPNWYLYEDLAPSDRLWEAYYKENQIEWEEFASRYVMEMRTKTDAVSKVNDLAVAGQDVALLCSCTDEDTCHNSLLKMVLEGKVAL